MRNLLLLLLVSTKCLAIGFIEGGAEYRKLKNASLLNKYSEFDNSQNQWTTLDKSNSENLFTSNLDVYLKAGTSFMFPGVPLYWGGYIRVTPNQSSTQKGEIAATSVTKTTKLGGFTIGPMLRYYILDLERMALKLDASIGFGKYALSQEIEAGSLNTLDANGLAGELALSAAVDVKLTGFLALTVSGGYSRLKTNYFTVKTANGSLYSGLKKDQRIQVRDGNNHVDFQLDRSGYLLGLGLTVSL